MPCTKSENGDYRANGIPNALPDFRNMGVLRTLLTVNIATMLAALLDSVSFAEFCQSVFLVCRAGGALRCWRCGWRCYTA